MNRRTATAALALLVPFGAIACSQADQERAETRTSEIAAEAESSASSLLEQGSRKADELEPGVRDQIEDSSRDVRESGLRNAAAAGGTKPFEDRNVAIDGALDCSATSEALGQYQIECTGTAEDGRAVKLVGTDPGEGVNATWVGTVADQELFREECVAVC